MYALLVSFTPKATEDEIMKGLGPIVKRLVDDTPGLVMKTYLAESPERWGGLYLFSDQKSAEGYLKGECFGWLSSSPLISDVDVRRFEVEDGPSTAFGTPSIPLADARAA